MAKYTINTTAEQDTLLAKSGADVQAVLENKIEELVNQGRKATHDEVASAYEKADSIKKAEFDTLVDEVKAAEVVAEEVII